MKKFTLSVPDELAERIDRYRDYLGNLSAIFQSAVDEKITKKEQFNARLNEVPDLDEIAARLKKEQQKAENDFFESGKEEGLSWVKLASYTDIKYVLNHDFSLQYGGRGHIATSVFQDEIVGDYLLETFQEDPILSSNCEEAWVDEFKEQWFLGWKEGVEEFWNLIREKL